LIEQGSCPVAHWDLYAIRGK